MGKINRFLFGLVFLCVLPVFIVTFLGRIQIEELVINKPKSNVSEVETELPLLVAKQISIQMPEECIKAQSVIARTNLLAAREAGKEEPQGFTMPELQTLWGNEFETYYEKLTDLIADTAGETLKYQGEYIYAAYHQVSAGNSRDMSEYYQKNVMPYLTSVACHEDATAEGYLEVYYWSEEDFLSLMKNSFPEEVLESSAEVVVTRRDTAGYVLEVMVGQTVCEGENFRKALNLPSACFEITLLEGDVRLVTMGRGHGFGLSQNTASILAEQGKNYKEILQYFYNGVVIE